jgi:hypothetical protein
MLAHTDFVAAGLLVVTALAMFWSERRDNVRIFTAAATLFVLAAILAFVLLFTSPSS